MKKNILLFIALITLSILSCSKDDDDKYPKTVNIKMEVITTRNTDATITRTLNNDTQEEEIDNLPYSFTYAQQEVNQGTYLQLTYVHEGEDEPSIEPNPNPGTFEEYDAELKISVDNEVVESETFTIESETGVIQVEYTFD